MKKIIINYKNYKIDEQAMLQLKKADLCKSVIAKSRPFEGDLLKQIKDFYKIDTTWSSSALEGNSLTITETKILLEEGITVGGKPLKDTLEICGHGEAYEDMFTLVKENTITVENIKHIHKVLMQKQIGDRAGQYKQVNNIITGSNFNTISFEEVEKQMEKLNKWMLEERKEMHPIVFAAETHRKLVYIHPFEDGNGRTARLVMNAILIQNGYLPCVIAPIIRANYIDALEVGRAGRYNEFVQLIGEAITETQKDFMRYMNLPMPNFKIEQSFDFER